MADDIRAHVERLLEDIQESARTYSIHDWLELLDQLVERLKQEHALAVNESIDPQMPPEEVQ